MAHSDRHLFVHLPHSRRAPGAIRAAEVPALHFPRYLGGCLVGARGGKGCDKSNRKGQFKRRWRRNVDFSPRTEKHSSRPLFSPHICASEGFRTAPQPIHSSN